MCIMRVNLPSPNLDPEQNPNRNRANLYPQPYPYPITLALNLGEPQCYASKPQKNAAVSWTDDRPDKSHGPGPIRVT